MEKRKPKASDAIAEHPDRYRLGGRDIPANSYPLLVLLVLRLRGNCPVCGKGPINPTLKDFVIRVALRDQPEHPIGGLRAYQCQQEQHIFFVMA